MLVFVIVASSICACESCLTPFIRGKAFMACWLTELRCCHSKIVYARQTLQYHLTHPDPIGWRSAGRQMNGPMRAAQLDEADNASRQADGGAPTSLFVQFKLFCNRKDFKSKDLSGHGALKCILRKHNVCTSTSACTSRLVEQGMFSSHNLALASNFPHERSNGTKSFMWCCVHKYRRSKLGLHEGTMCASAGRTWSAGICI